MKTIYQKPNTKIVMLRHQAHILVNSPEVHTVNTNLTGTDAITIGENDGIIKNARSRSFDDWDDDEDF